jgi:trk system potassium uptake protein TrkA
LVEPASDRGVVVIGLGRFGGAVAESLVRLGHDVLGIDESAEIAQEWSDRLTHVVQADTTSPEVLRRLGVAGSAARWWASAPTWRPAC